MDRSLASELPYWEFLDGPVDHAILWDGSLACALELVPLDVECFDETRLNQLTLGLRSFVNALAEGLSIQILVKVSSDFTGVVSRHEASRATQVEFLRNLDSQRVAGIKTLIDDELVFRPRVFLSIRTQAVKQPGKFSLTPMKKFSAAFAGEHDARLQVLLQSSTTCESALSSLGFSCAPLSRQEIIDLIYGHLNPRRARAVSAPELHPTVEIDGGSPRGQLVFGDMILDQEDFVLDALRTRVITLKTLPEATYAGMMSSFLSLPFKYELSLAFQIPEQAGEVKALEQKRRMAHSLAHSTSNRVSDLESESRLSQTTDLIREIIETGQRIFRMELSFILRAENQSEGMKDLDLRTKEILGRFKSLSGAEGIQETVGSWKVFKSILPVAPIQLVRGKRVKTNNLVDFLPLFGPSLGDHVPTVLLRTRSGSLYSMNQYDPKLTNYNLLATGSSGSGKSFAHNSLMLQQLARGTKVFIIDIGGSYRKLTRVLGGQYFEINLSDNYAINPFHIADPSVAPSGERIKSLVNIIEQMVVDEGEKLTRLERVQIEEALTQVYTSCRTQAGPRSPRISDFARFCEKSPEEGLKRIAKLLFPWIGDAPYGRLLDRDGKIDTASAVVAFDLKNLSSHKDLQSVMILILTSFILDQVENDRSVPKRVLLDEAWELLKSPAASNFMEYAARTFRKTGSGISFITQGVEEIIASGLGAAILNNTATKLIMIQKGDTKVLRDALKLNSQELRIIQGLEQRKGVFSEGFLMAGESRQVVRIQPSPVEYWVSTSDARDNQYLAELEARGMSLEDAILRAATDHPFGVAQAQAKRAA